MSTQDQELGTSLDDQKAKGLLLGQLHDYSVDARPFEEGGHLYSGDESGALPLSQRPIMQRLIADAQAHRFDAVCFTKIDRIGRRLKLILEIWDALDEAGVTVLVIDPAIDTSTPIGRLIRNILGSVAEFEHETIRERTQGGITRRLAPRTDGERTILPPAWLSGAYYGYRYQKANRMEGVPARVTVHDPEADVIRRIFRRRPQGGGVSNLRIARELTKDGIPNPGGTGAWSAAAVSRILNRRAYTGEGEWGLTVEVKNKNGRRSTVKRCDGRPPTKVAFPPIITPQEWDDAHAVPTCGVRPVRAGVDKYLLRGGMVRCAQHDLSMGGSGGGHGGRYYQCYSHPKAARGEKATHSVPAPPLDVVVWEEVIAFLRDPQRGRAAAAQIIAQADQRAAALTERLGALEGQLQGLATERQALLRQYRRGRIGEADLDQSMAEVEAQAVPLQEEVTRVRADLALAQADVPAADEIDGICTLITNGAAFVTPQEKRAVLDLLQVGVRMTGYDYEIRGIVPEMTVRGTLEVGVLPARGR